MESNTLTLTPLQSAAIMKLSKGYDSPITISTLDNTDEWIKVSIASEFSTYLNKRGNTPR